MKYVITIGRQYGSGGREVGKKLAEKLNIKYYDKELLAIAAKKSGLNESFIQSNDEKATNSLLYSIVMGYTNLNKHNNESLSIKELAHKAQIEGILSAAEKDRCVIVGRCADYILKDSENVFSVFISASDEFRINRVAVRENIDNDKAIIKIKKIDKERKNYYNLQANGLWGEAKNYDICINVSKAGINGAVEIISNFVRYGLS